MHDEFYTLLQTLNRDKNLTLVLVSHDIKMITREAMHIACVNKTLVCHTSPKEFLKENETKNILEDVKIIIPHTHNH
jgi:zinc transport system ATP-binding protein